ncbi:ATP-binding cassette domain-containing protein [Rheinheimera aquimaris]|uniref:ATP-binding cassette domain-containing protein n=1 Tax=Rheinheimera aquimaris TaxID=412437 RepID=UPI003A96C6E9
MTFFSFSPCSFNLVSGETLYHDIKLTLDSGINGLIGRNGAGKSVLAIQLAALHPKQCYLLAQLPQSGWQQRSIAALLGLEPILRALQQLASGQFDGNTLSLIDNHWQLADDLQAELRQINAPTDYWQNASVLSGGQMTRLRLWWAFYQPQPLLILDEPSNHLDTAGRNWLSEQLRQFAARPGAAILLISHDRALLQQVEVLYELTSNGLQRFGGNYAFYQQQRQLQHAALQQQQKHAEKQLQQRQRNAQAAAEKAAKRQRQGEKRRGSQATILLDYSKNRAQSATSARRVQEQQQLHQAEQQLQQIKAQQQTLKPQQFYLSAETSAGTKTLITAEALQLPFGNRTPLSFSWSNKQRVNLQGLNGSGKSTLLQVLAGKVDFYSGTLRLNCDVQYLDQHFSVVDRSATALNNLRSYCPDLTETLARTLLAGVGFRNNQALKPAAALSGGELMKLAMLMVSQHTGRLLLLDEPDNHLDLQAKQLLAEALAQYQSGFVLVSHDVDFVSQSGVDTVLQL